MPSLRVLSDSFIHSADRAGEDHGRSFPINLPYSVFLYRKGETRGIEARADYLGSDGMYCISPEVFEPLEELECEVRIQGEKLVVMRCRAEIVRVVADWKTPGFGIDCKMLDREIPVDSGFCWN